MKRYGLVSEATIAGSIQLTYKTGNGNEGILYSFYASNGELYSVKMCIRDSHKVVHVAHL